MIWLQYYHWSSHKKVNCYHQEFNAKFSEWCGVMQIFERYLLIKIYIIHIYIYIKDIYVSKKSLIINYYQGIIFLHKRKILRKTKKNLPPDTQTYVYALNG